MRSLLSAVLPALASAAACKHTLNSTESSLTTTRSVSPESSATSVINIVTSGTTEPIPTAIISGFSSSSSPITISAAPILDSTSASTVSLEAVSTTSTALCGDPSASIVLSAAKLIVAADIMNPDLMPSGSSLCSGYYGVSEDDVITWSTNLNIADDENGFDYKGYSNIAIPGGNTGIGSTLGEFSSIPAQWEWSISNTTAWLGDVIYDFVFSPIEGDWSSSSAVELMLYLYYSDELGFIGESNGVVSTISLFGVDGWSVYYGQGTGNVWMTASLVAPKDARYDGSFNGDIMEWINALKDVANLDDTMYCSAANSGMEAFYGDITVQHVSSLSIVTTQS
ncbi:concanavalin A-like lectin/glucanase domain-containing protein [Xylariales sp. PMI_506]|nr:concanavalin A-like lectin/glucanase domain-containing protein [Xylariales sp. PMI_506]